MEIIPKYPSCFVCGNENPSGLKLTFYKDQDMVTARFKPRKEWCGYANIVHGGVIAAILDEGLGWTGYSKFNNLFLTLELNVRYIKMVSAEHEYDFVGKIVKWRNDFYIAEGIIKNLDGVVYAKGQGKYICKDIREIVGGNQ
ncbi:PaaI family thioesterase [bacterium]|nr:PaaI family thioesterase [bacterium]